MEAISFFNSLKNQDGGVGGLGFGEIEDEYEGNRIQTLRSDLREIYGIRIHNLSIRKFKKSNGILKIYLRQEGV